MLNDKTISTLLCACACLVVVAALGSAATAAEKQFRAGAFAIDITPQSLPVIVNGGFTEGKVSQITDPLHARCIVLDDGANQIAFAVVDSCVMPRELVDKAKELASEKTGIPTERMLVSATHCHSAPSVIGVLGSTIDEPYAAYLPGRIAEGIAAAQKNLAPARIGWAVGNDPNNVFCRRFRMKPGTAPTVRFTGKEKNEAQMNPGFNNPNVVERTGPADTSLPVVSIQSSEGQPLALLSNYSTHYAGAPAISADYFAVFAERIKELVGAGTVSPAFVGIMSNGTSGDANCIDFLNPDRKFTYKTVGQDTANAAYEAYKTIRYYDWVPLVMREELLTLDVRMPSPEEVAEAKAYLAKPKSETPNVMERVYAQETVFLSELPPTREIKIQTIRLGGLGIVALPNEAYGATGLGIKAKSPLKPTFTIDLANGYAGYLPPPEQHALGGYTTWRARSSFLEEQAEPKIKAKVLEMLQQVTDARAGEEAVPSRDLVGSK